ncbi:hypothetical protein [Marinobacterium lutimaris]|uniref:Uncharacterized protein n=1 Tax=Marinobacterium lutimaris TaxID=568106 RepID=A0A1H5TDU1_9GAMM|nr:hypothetical protein [Marinobacterium lutimaris]SEF60933.1 hypothetical protein SAMN05444390_10146 [Marinobacterium lutimaris]
MMRRGSLWVSLLFTLLLALSPWESALAVESCAQPDGMQPVASGIHCSDAGSTCHGGQLSSCCQVLCLLKARALQSLLTPVIPLSGHWQLGFQESPLPGHNRPLLHPPAG